MGAAYIVSARKAKLASWDDSGTTMKCMVLTQEQNHLHQTSGDFHTLVLGYHGHREFSLHSFKSTVDR